MWLLRDRPAGVLSGAIGYMAFDIVAIGACFEAFGYFPPLGVLVVAYLIGQLGGLLPLPGGIGGIELGLVGSFAVFNVPVSASAAAVLAYRVLQLWIPAILGTLAFVQLRDLLRGKQQDAATICEPLAEPIEVELQPRERQRPSAPDLRQPHGDRRQHLGQRLAVGLHQAAGVHHRAAHAVDAGPRLHPRSRR